MNYYEEVERDYGKLKLNITKILEEKGVSKNKVCTTLNIPRSNFNRYCRDEFQRIDAVLICKLCHYLGVSVGDIIEYVPPTED